ncbi:MAG: phosphatase PAP2 family protein [Jatrophihabitantaceae bacterium]
MNYQWLRDINNLSVHSQFLNDLMIWAAKYLIYAVGVALAVLLYQQARRKHWITIAAVALGLVAAFVFGLIAAAVHPEQRPFTTHPRIHLLVSHAAGGSFPSDHATAAFAIALAVIVFVSARWGLALFVTAVVIGFARVYDGLHYPGDIGGGLLVAAVGVAVAALALYVARRRIDPRVVDKYTDSPTRGSRSAVSGPA